MSIQQKNVARENSNALWGVTLVSFPEALQRDFGRYRLSLSETIKARTDIMANNINIHTHNILS